MTAAAAHQLYAGFATVDITPEDPVGMTLRGMPRVQGPARGVLDRLHARASYIESGESRFLMIVLDICTVEAIKPHDQTMIDALAAWSGMAHKDIWICATHTHASVGESNWQQGGDARRRKVFSRWIGQLMAKVHAVGKEAIGRRQPVELGHGSIPIDGVATSRRVKTSDGIVITGWRDGSSPVPGMRLIDRGVYDADLNLVVFRDLQHRPVGAIINYPCHVHTYPVEYISAELASATARLLERRLPGAIAIYTLGAEGTSSLCHHAEAQSDDPDAWVAQYKRQMRRFSTRLVDGAMRAYQDMRFHAQAPMRTAHASASVDAGDRGTIEEPVSAVAIGDLVLVGEIEEMFCEFGLELRSTSPFATTCVIALNGPRRLGYFPTQEGLEEGGYESFLDLERGSMDRVIAAAKGLVRKVHRAVGSPKGATTVTARWGSFAEDPVQPSGRRRRPLSGTPALAQARRLLLASLRHRQPFVRADGARLLGALRLKEAKEAKDAKDAVDGLQDMLRTDRRYTKVAAVYALGDIGDRSAVPLLRSLATEPGVFDFSWFYGHDLIRIAAVLSLLRLGQDDATELISDLLRLKGLEAPLQLGPAILALPDTPASKPLRSYVSLDFLDQWHRRKISASNHFRIAQCLAHHPTADARSRLDPYLDHVSAYVRPEAARALLRHDETREAVQNLHARFQSEGSPHARIRFACLLESFGLVDSGPLLTRALGHESYFVRALAADALASTGRRQAIPRLRTLAEQDPHYYPRVCALEALEVLAGAEAAPVLGAHLDDPHPRVAIQAAKSLLVVSR